MPSVDWAQVVQNRAITGPHFSDKLCSYVLHAALLVVHGKTLKSWWQCHFYDRIMKLGLMQLNQLLGFCDCRDHYWSPPVPLDTRMNARTETTECEPVDLWCVNNGFLNVCLRQTVFGANWSLCCILSHLLEHISLFLPVTQSESWQAWFMVQTHMVKHRRSQCTKIMLKRTF